MIGKIDHIGIVVDNIDDTLKLFESAFNLKPTVVKEAMEGKMKVAFIPVGDGEVELLQPLDPNLPMSDFLRARGQGFHHISFATNDIESEISRMKKEDVAFMTDGAFIGAHGVKIIFTKPETTGGINIELCEES